MRNQAFVAGRRIEELISGARRILLVTHVAPDGDAIGSMLGLGWLLKAQGKELILTCEDPVPESCSWLPGSGGIVRQVGNSVDLVIGLDCSDQHRMGDVLEASLSTLPLINIDHHVTNTNFGTFNWVDPGSVATAQMILELAEVLDWPVSENVAVCLLSGIVTDTRAFRTSNVDAMAMRATVRLMEAGASLHEITRRALDQRPLDSVRLWGQAIDSLHLEDGILWTSVTCAMRDRWRLHDNGYSGLANFLSGVREADVVIVFTERNDDTVDVGMRSVPGYDVAQTALALGGGGHPQAAGCTLGGNLEQVRERVLSEVRRTMAEQKKEDA